LGLPSIDSLEDLSSLTHLSSGLLFRLSKYADKFYFTYDIPKKSGEARTISQPSKDLKAIQSWILRNILDRLSASSACKGFEKKANLLVNAEPHIGANAFMHLDIEDFFPSIKINQVWSVFRTVGYNPSLSSILAQICTYKGTLPQGSPASPKLSNLISLQLDNRLLGYVGKRGITYTRYADDLTFSAYNPIRLIKSFPFIHSIIRSEGFSLNTNKTRFSGAGKEHKVTGLIVTDSKAGIGRKRLRKIRSKINNICKHSKTKVSRTDIAHIIGWLAFINSVDEERRKILDRYIASLRKKYPKSAVALLPTL
jgi:retron-type reverse transcriptase